MADINSELDALLSDEPVNTGTEGGATTAQMPAETGTGSEATTTQPRDEHGKFAPKQTEGTATTTEPVIDAQPATPDKPNNGVPVRAVQEERQKRQEAEASAEALRRELAELRGTVQALQSQQKPVQQQEEKPAPTLWDDPDNYLQSQINPVQQQMMEMKEFMSENLAVQSYGEEAVNAAKQAIEQVARTPEGQQVIAKMMQSRHPFGDLVKWHKQHEAMRLVGDDPNAWLEAEMEKRLADPAYQAKVLERIRGTAASNTTRSAPAVSLPPSLSGLPAGGNAAAEADMSDAALFTNALR